MALDMTGIDIVNNAASLMDSIVLLLIEMEREQYYQQFEFGSLLHWVEDRFGPLMERDILEWDYLRRACRMVVHYLIPAENQFRILDEESGEVLNTAERMAEHTAIRDLYRLPYYFGEATDEERRQMVEITTRPNKGGDFKDLFKQIKERLEEGDDAGDDGTQERDASRRDDSRPDGDHPVSRKNVATITYNSDRTIDIVMHIDEVRLVAVESLLEGLVEFEFAT